MFSFLKKLFNSKYPPGVHPGPPERWPEIIPTHTVPQGTELFRVHLSRYGPIHFGGLQAQDANTRFRAPNQEYGTLYLATDMFGAFRETIGAMSGYRLVAESNLRARSLSVVTADRDLELVDLTGAGLTWINADARLTTGSYAIAQKWTLALWQHPRAFDGLYYRSRYDPSRFCIVLFCDRFNPDSLSAQPLNQNFLEDSFIPQLIQILSTYNYRIISGENPPG